MKEIVLKKVIIRKKVCYIVVENIDTDVPLPGIPLKYRTFQALTHFWDKRKIPWRVIE